MGKADIHIHSDYSDGMATVEEILEYVEHQTDLDLIALTDHDMFDGADKARELAAQRNYRFAVITGMEVTTIEGHLLALGIDKPVKSLQPLDRTIAQIHEQGGIVIVPHPMSWLIRSVGRNGILRIHNHKSDEVYFDGFETLNPSFAGQVTAVQATLLNQNVLHLAPTGGSDAHTLTMIGTGLTHFPGTGVEAFRQALQTGTTTADGHFWTRDELRELAQIGPRQMFRSLIILPTRHVRRAVSTLGKGPSRPGA
ncbi:MAG: CehA/McbA family metallohydrolase [Anaerolineae bacterium]